MKEGIHPKYQPAKVICACGNVFETNSTKSELKVDVCSKCHHFWTGNLKNNTKEKKKNKKKKKYGIE